MASKTEWKGWSPAVAGAGVFLELLQLRTGHKGLNPLWDGGSAVLPHTQPLACSIAEALSHHPGLMPGL